jgi:isopenicillin N synthase-like dioxygenase
MPKRYVHAMTDFTDIKILDLSALQSRNEDDLAALANDFLHAYSTAGFAYIRNHGIPQPMIDGVFEASHRFHALPHDQKMAVALDQNHRGFIPINTSTDKNSKLADVTRPNQSESFMVMREDTGTEKDIYLSGPNQWPDLENFRAQVSAYNDAMSGLARDLIATAATALGTPPQDLLQHFQTPTTWLRLLYYPPTDPMDGDDLYGSAPHTDFGALTILAQDDIGGLQVMTPSGAWIDAPRIQGTFVVNVGDMLHRWSNGILKSTPHRVINRSGKPRYSCPFFFDPHVSADITPLASCGPAKFASINFGDFLKSELEASYDAHKAP